MSVSSLRIQVRINHLEQLDTMVRWDWRGLFVSASILLLLLTSCRRKEDFREILLISHAGMGLNIENSIYHDNSLESVELATSMQGCDGVEIDVQLSADGQLWMYHDATLNSETNGQGCIPESSDMALMNVKYHSIHQEKLCRLSEILKIDITDKQVFLDLRHLDYCSNTFVPIDTMITRIKEVFSSVEDVWVITNYQEWIGHLKLSGFKVLFQLDEMEIIHQVSFEIDGFIVRNSLISSDQVNEIHHSGKKLFIFDVRSPKGIRAAFEKHPDGVLSDDIRAAIIEKN